MGVSATSAIFAVQHLFHHEDQSLSGYYLASPTMTPSGVRLMTQCFALSPTSLPKQTATTSKRRRQNDSCASAKVSLGYMKPGKRIADITNTLTFSSSSHPYFVLLIWQTNASRSIRNTSRHDSKHAPKPFDVLAIFDWLSFKVARPLFCC